jgi:hypothetical protein
VRVLRGAPCAPSSAARGPSAGVKRCAKSSTASTNWRFHPGLHTAAVRDYLHLRTRPNARTSTRYGWQNVARVCRTIQVHFVSKNPSSTLACSAMAPCAWCLLPESSKWRTLTEESYATIRSCMYLSQSTRTLRTLTNASFRRPDSQADSTVSSSAQPSTSCANSRLWMTHGLCATQSVRCDFRIAQGARCSLVNPCLEDANVHQHTDEHGEPLHMHGSTL